MLTPLEAARLAVEKAKAEGAVEAEAYASRSRGYTVVSMLGKIMSLETHEDEGVGIRVAVEGGRVGYAYTTRLDEAGIEEAARLAVRAARSATPDPKWRGLPSPSPGYPNPALLEIYEAELEQVHPERLIEDAKRMIDAAEEEKVTLNEGRIGVSVTWRAVVNTSGIEREESGTAAWATAMVNVPETAAGVPGPVVWWGEGWRTTIPDAESVVRTAASIAKLTKQRGRIEPSTKLPVVLHPLAFAELLSLVGEMLSGELVARGRSPLAAKRGELVFSEKLTLVDDATARNMMGTWSFDGEGVATRRNVLVERGVVRGFLLDSYWAGWLGEESTGSAWRRSYQSPPRPSMSNVIVEPGGESLDDLLEGRVLVVYYVMGMHTANPDTGEYSVVANPAVLYERGQPRGWVPGVVVTGNVLKDLSAGLAGVSGERVKALNYWLPWVRLETPTLTLRG